MKKTVVTGASGFIGKALTRRLLEQGWLVYAVIRNAGALFDISTNRLIPVLCDFANYNELSKKISDSIDCFIHLAWAGVSGPNSRNVVTQAENIKASSIAMEQALQMHAQKFIFAGSSYQYRMEPTAIAGKRVFVQKNLYGLAKEASTNLLHAAALETGMAFNSILFTNVYGVGDTSKRSTNVMIEQLLAEKSLNLISGEHYHDWTYIDDAVNGIIAVLERGHRGVEYYIGSRKLTTFRTIITQVRDILQPEAELNFGCYDDSAYIDYSKIDLERLYKDTGFQCQADFKTSIINTADWLSQQGGKPNMIDQNLKIVPPPPARLI